MFVVVAAAGSDAIKPVPYKVPAKLPDAAALAEPFEVKVGGFFLGPRIENNAKNRLAKVDLEPLLAGFRKKPGSHPWIGEHIGKWLHAATLAWANTGDPTLREKMDYAVRELIAAQEPDGYLGTYVPEKRFGLYPNADWDVWSHKYNLIGLLTYYHYTGNTSALDASRKIGDLLIKTFGPGKKSILSAGTHVGMAATSVLEPMVLLYRHTGEEKYLEFARYIVKSWDEPNGPKIINSLLSTKQVNKTANGKAYEMLSNLVGLAELARVTGERQFIEPLLNAWADIVSKRLYITGSASQGEHFRDDFYLPNHEGAHVSETCVTTTWIQFNSQLLRLTGEARFGNELEKTFYNHLAAAQRPDGAQWCYYTALEGVKPYGPGINCCVSSGPRGMALAPLHAFLKFAPRGAEPEELAINIIDEATIQTTLNGQKVTVKTAGNGDRLDEGLLTMRVEIQTEAPARFGIRIRTPDWAQPMEVSGVGKTKLADGWTIIPARKWENGDTFEFTIQARPRLIIGEHGNAGRAALAFGPLIMAYDEKRNAEPARMVGFVENSAKLPTKFAVPEAGLFAIEIPVRSGKNPNPHPALFVSFADAGADGGRYQVWLFAPGAEIPKNLSLFNGATEKRSRQGNQNGSINDGDPASFVVTYDGTARPEDWFALIADAPVTIQRVVYRHGHTFHDGGWFDASAGKPRIQVQRERNGSWETVGELSDYPATTATDSKGIKDSQAFTLQLKEPTSIVGLRVIGKPACGDNPRQAFSSCAELEAFAK